MRARSVELDRERAVGTAVARTWRPPPQTPKVRRRSRQLRLPAGAPDRPPASGNRSYWPCAQRYFDRRVLALDVAGLFQALAECGQLLCIRTGEGYVHPSTKLPSSRKPLLKASSSGLESSGVRALMYPTTGVVASCVRAAFDHTTRVPPKSDMNSRRFS
jgi:hypothetical protein